MKRFVLITALFLALGVTSAQAVTLTVALDKSGSNPLLADPHFAASAANFVAGRIRSLKEGDVVRIRSFGARSKAANLLDQTFVLSRRLRARQVAEAVRRYVAALPQQAGQAQPSTNIIAFLEFDSGLDCAGGGAALLLTDGLEASQYMSPRAFLAGRQSLPKPDADLSGCEVVFYGLGAGLPPKSARFMRREWTHYVTTAGGHFTAIMP